MQLFLVEVRKRTETPSIIWLHDGLWIGREVDDHILYAAEKHVRQLLFPQASVGSSLFAITDLHTAWRDAFSQIPPPSYPPLFGCCPQRHKRGWRRRKITRQFPVAKFSHRQASKRKVHGYFERISKRFRRSRP